MILLLYTFSELHRKERAKDKKLRERVVFMLIVKVKDTYIYVLLTCHTSAENCLPFIASDLTNMKDFNRSMAVPFTR
jgi:hypothetical protein